MRRSALVRYGAPAAVFAAVLAGLVALAAGGDARPRAKRLEPLPIGAPAGARGATAGEGDTAARTDIYVAGRIVIPDELLAGLPARGPVHDVSGDVGNDRVAALARALGLVGTVESDAEGWRVRTGDRVLRVFRQNGGSWYFGPDKEATVVATAEPAPAEKPSAPPDQPQDQPQDQPGSTGAGAPGSTGADTPVSSEPCEGDCPPAPRPAPCPVTPEGSTAHCPYPGQAQQPRPSDEEARASAQRVFDAAGLTDATITLNDAWSATEVVASPRVGGLPTVGFETRVTVGTAGVVQYANGVLGTTSLKDDYPLLPPRDAVNRSTDGPRAAVEPAPCPTDEKCPTPEPREARTLRLGLQFMPSYDAAGGGYLAPAWLMTFGEEKWDEPALALPDEYVAKPPPASDQPAVEDPAAPDAPVSHP